jgi:hypothetical protein
MSFPGSEIASERCIHIKEIIIDGHRRIHIGFLPHLAVAQFAATECRTRHRVAQSVQQLEYGLDDREFDSR